MSRTVDRSRPYTDGEKEYLRTLGSAGVVAIELNDRQFADFDHEQAEAERVQAANDAADEAERQRLAAEQEQALEEDSFHPDDEARVLPLTVRELREALKKEGLDSTGDKEDLQFRLLEHLDAQRNGSKDEITEDEENAVTE